MREYYERNKEKLKESSRLRYKNMTEEEKEAVKQHQKDRYHAIVSAYKKNKKFFWSIYKNGTNTYIWRCYYKQRIFS